MQNRLTKALGLGDIDSVSEYERLTAAILSDNFLFKRVVELLVAERGADAIQSMHRLEIEAFQKRLNFIRKNPTLRVEWKWMPQYQTATNRVPMLRARRFFGDNKSHEEQAFWQPSAEWSVAQFSAISWYGSQPPQEVVAAFESWLKEPNAEWAAEMRQQQVFEAEKQQKKQATLTGDLAAAVVGQGDAFHDYSKPKPSNTLHEVGDLLDAAITKLGGGK